MFHKVTEGIDVSKVIEAIDNNPQLWDKINIRRTYEGSPHSQMVDIWVRFGEEITPNEHDAVWYESEVAEAVKPIAHHIMDLVGAERLGGILITKLPPHGRIEPHIDSGWHAEFYDKYYVAIKSPEGSAFGFESGDILSKQGDCYMFENKVLHWVTNDTEEERISMIICMR